MFNDEMRLLVWQVAHRKVDVADISPVRRKLLDEALRPYGPRSVGEISGDFMQILPDGELDARLAASALRMADYDAARLDLERRTRSFVLREPTVLYRSVSLAGLRDLLVTGVVRSPLNRWHAVDLRRIVLFGDELRSVVFQGEDPRRAVLCTLASHPEYLSVRAARGVVSRVNGDTTPAECKAAKEHLRLAEQRLNAVIEPLVAAEKGRREQASASSVVMRTVPLTGARVWPHGHRLNRMYGIIAEYGFGDSVVSVRQVDAILFVKDAKVVGETTPEAACDMLREQTNSLSPGSCL